MTVLGEKSARAGARERRQASGGHCRAAPAEVFTPGAFARSVVLHSLILLPRLIRGRHTPEVA